MVIGLQEEKVKTMRLKRVCPICHYEEGERIDTIQMELPPLYQLPNKYDVVCCSNCGFTFGDVTATQDDYNKYYANSNMYSSTAVLRKQLEDKINYARVELLCKYIDIDMKILDIGCGNGGLLKALYNRGFHNIFGLDPSVDSIEKLSAAGIEGIVSNIFDEPESKWVNYFDVVISTAVIEHIFDLDGYVDNIKKYMKNNGILYVDAPSVEGFVNSYSPIPNQFNHEHINYFSIYSLDNLMYRKSLERINDESDVYFTAETNSFNEPIMQCIYKKSKKIQNEIKKKDKISKELLIEYFKKARSEEQGKNIRINEFIRKHKKVILWGTGSYSMQLIKSNKNLEQAIEYCVDSNENKWGTEFCGRRILNPQEIRSLESYPILICAIRYANDIKDKMQELGLDNEYLCI